MLPPLTATSITSKLPVAVLKNTVKPLLAADVWSSRKRPEKPMSSLDCTSCEALTPRFSV